MNTRVGDGEDANNNNYNNNSNSRKGLNVIYLKLNEYKDEI